MISLRHGILSIEYGFDSFAKKLYEVLFVLNCVSIFLFAHVASISPILNIALFLSSLFVAFSKNNGSIVIPKNFIWYGIFTVYVLFSCSWCKNFRVDDFETVIKLFIILITISSITIYIETEKDLDRIMSLYIFAIAIIIIYELINTPVELWTSGFLGSYSTGSNSNETSYCVFFAEFLAFYKAYIKNQKLYYFLVIGFLFFVLYGSSRKALFLSLGGPLLLILFTSEKKGYIFRLIGFILVGLLTFRFIMTNENLYNTLGTRLERLSNFYETSTGDKSMLLRAYYKDLAKSIFKESPIIGAGLRSFSHALNSNSYVYCHNNYWQILSEFGIIGFIIYYSLYIISMVKLFINYYKTKNKLSLLFLIFFVLLMIFEIGIVSILTKFHQITIAIAYASTYVKSEESDGRKYNYGDLLLSSGNSSLQTNSEI